MFTQKNHGKWRKEQEEELREVVKRYNECMEGSCISSVRNSKTNLIDNRKKYALIRGSKTDGVRCD